MTVPRRSHPLQDSQLFAIRTKRKLWEVLKTDFKSARELLEKGADAYSTIIVPSRNGKKPRTAQNPEPCLKKIQQRINKLLQRVIHPEYVQAGLKKLSYITNAHRHAADEWVCCIDVHHFYPNCKSKRVEEFFYHVLRCSPDVCQILARLTTINGHLPTGGPASLLLSFWSYKIEFDKIARAADQHNLRMTLYVDDLTFSGAKARMKFLNAIVKPILASAELKGHKIKIYSPKTSPKITGVMLTLQGSRVPFERERKISLLYQSLRLQAPPPVKLKQFNVLISCLIEASSVDDRYKSQVTAMVDCRKNFLRDHPDLLRDSRKSQQKSNQRDHHNSKNAVT